MVSWSNPLKTYNFESCPKFKKPNFQWWGFATFVTNPIFYNQRIQLKVLCNSNELDFKKFDKIHDFWAHL
jgi:hypothetical protein